MKRLIASVLALGLAATGGTAFAQSIQDGRYDDGYRDSYRAGGDAETYYDEARVIRVDPVLGGGYREFASDGRRCYETTTAGRYESDGYTRSRRYDEGYAREGLGDNANRSMATIAGGVIGAVLGSHVGGGSGRFAATAVGSMVGGMAGREIYDQSQRNRYVRPGVVRVCDPEPVRGGDSRYSSGDASAYDVTYEYNGRRYTRRMDYHPGDRIRVRVEVMPQ